MALKKGANRHLKNPVASPQRGSPSPRKLLIVAVAVVAVGAALWWIDGRGPTRAAGRQGDQPSTAVLASPEKNAQRLIGRWQRTDAGYVIEIRSVDHSGEVDAAYFNPDPIHVSQAVASDAGGALDLFIELMDIGYPGATYKLRYIPEYDALAGVYHQPTAGQDFEIAFQRK